ncbi:MAG: helix-turn-helix transcriptional regulator [Chloroflexota bacterium]
MNPDRFGRLVRMLRLRQRLTQADLARRAGVSRQSVSLVERGRPVELRLRIVQSIVIALGARLEIRLFWNGPELERMIDAGHASTGASVSGCSSGGGGSCAWRSASIDTVSEAGWTSSPGIREAGMCS